MSPEAHGPVHAKLTARTGPRRCGVGVRVSATARRGAAPYADGAQWLVRARTHDCLPSLVGERLSSRLTWHDFVYVTMVPSPQRPPLIHHPSTTPPSF